MNLVLTALHSLEKREGTRWQMILNGAVDTVELSDVGDDGNCDTVHWSLVKRKAVIVEPEARA